MQTDRAVLESAIEHFEQARVRLSDKSSFRSRTLLDMLLLELGKDLARLPERGRPRHGPQG